MGKLISEAWKAYRREAGQRYVLHYLEYAKSHNQASISDYNQLEEENENLLAAIQSASKDHLWLQVRELVWALSADGEHGYLRVRGRWRELQTVLELAVNAAIQDNAAGDWLAFRINLASLLIEFGQFKAAQEMYGLVLPVLESIQMDGLLSTVHHHLGQIEQRQGQFATASKCYLTSLQYAEAAKDAERIAVVNHSLGTLAQLQGQYEVARQRYQAALASWQAAGDQESTAATLHNLGMLEQEQGAYDRAKAYYRQSLELEQSWNHRSGIATSLENLGVLAMKTGAYEEADRYLAASFEIRLAIGDQRGIAELYHNQGVLAQVRGKHHLARELYLRSLEAKQDLGDQVGAARTRAQLGLLALEAGKLDEADGYLQECLAIFQRENTRAELADVYHQLGLLAQERGSQTRDENKRSQCFLDAEAYYRRSLDLDQAMGNAAGIAKSLHQLGSLSLEAGNLQNTEQLLKQSYEIKLRLGDRSGLARTLSELAGVRAQSAERRDWDEAERMLKQAASELDALGERLSAAQVSYRLANLLVMEGRDEEASAWLNSALDAYLGEGLEQPPYMWAVHTALRKKLSASNSGMQAT